MHPVLFKIPVFGGITVYTYGFFVALAFVVGMIWVSMECRRVGEDPKRAMDLGFYIILAALFGSRILHILVSERERFLDNPLIIFKIWEGGLVFYGGVIGAVAVTVWFVWRYKLNFWKYTDIFAPAMALGHAIGRIGCFMAGCCYGLPVGKKAWYSLTFPYDPHSFAPAGVALFPTQLMEVAGELIIFGILLLVRSKKRFEGQLIATWLILYAIMRAFVEFFRGDVTRGFVIEPWLSTSQFISIVLFIIGIVIYIKKWRTKEL